MTQKRLIWQKPWQSAEAVLILSALWVVGFALEWASGGTGIDLPAFPYNLWLGAALVFAVLALHSFGRKGELVRFLVGTHNAVATVLAYLLLVIVMGSITQRDAALSPFWRHLGLGHITRSWPFILLNIYLLLSLGLLVVRRAWPFQLRNLGFFANHFGLWLALWAAGIGAPDVQRLTMKLSTENGRPVFHAYTADSVAVELPFAVKINEFLLDEYPPKYALISNRTGEMTAPGVPSFFELPQGEEKEVYGLGLKLLTLYPEAVQVGDTYQPVNEPGAAPAACVRIARQGRADTVWVSCGSTMYIPIAAKLDSAYSLAMTIPEPERFRSKVTVFTPEGTRQEIEVEVNKPFSIAGWKLYQLDYNKAQGRRSTVSYLEAVRDPWLAVVYTGIGLMLAGAIYLMVQGRFAQRKNVTE